MKINKMQSFSGDISPLNKENFEKLWIEKSKDRLRKHIYNFILSRNNDNDFFDIDIFNRKYIKDINKTNNIVNDIVVELNKLGWKTYIGFGGTGLYIYDSDDLPVGVY
jgi:hypothetical protein